MDANQRRGVALALTWTAVAGAVGLFSYETEEYDPNLGHFAPPWVSFAFIGCVAVAIIGANIAGRLKFTDVVIRAFETGFKSAERHFIEMRNAGVYTKTENDHEERHTA